jgi:hypothetical protein
MLVPRSILHRLGSRRWLPAWLTGATPRLIWPAKSGRFRRVPPVAVRPGEGLLT